MAHGVVLTAGGHRRVLDPGDFYKTKTQCQSAVNSCYIPLKNLYTYKMMIATLKASPTMYIASGTQDAQLDISPSQPRFGADMWTYGYRGVMYCNMAVTGIENSTIDENDRNSLAAEAKVLRAFYYYLLIELLRRRALLHGRRLRPRSGSTAWPNCRACRPRRRAPR